MHTICIILSHETERKEFMQDIQHKKQTAIRTAQNQTRNQHACKWLQKHRRHTETNKHL